MIYRRRPLVRRARLDPRPKRMRAPAARPYFVTEEERLAAAAERFRLLCKAAEEHARTYGAEYGQEFLRQVVFNRQGCDLCGRFHPPAELHHTTTRARGGGADVQVILGRACHRLGDKIGWTSAQARHGVDLVARAAEHAAEGLALEFLPVEPCALCLEAGRLQAWHSRRYMLDLVEDGKPTRRICRWCAPPGPP